MFGFDSTPPRPTLVTSRRALLTRAGAATLSTAVVALLAGRESLAASGGYQLAAMKGDVDILNSALGLEHEAIAAYQVGAKSGLLKKPVLDVAVKFQGDHKQHRDELARVIKHLGGKPVAAMAKYNFPVDRLKSQADVLKFAATLEKQAASAYLAAVPMFKTHELAKAAASILGAETMHWSVLLGALGENPSPVAFIA
jgi:rubrerythrin